MSNCLTELYYEKAPNYYPVRFLAPMEAGVKPACGDGFAWIGLVEKFSSLAVDKKVLTFSVLCWLVTSPRPLREGVNVLGWLVTFPRPLREGVNVLGWLVTFPRPLRERVQSCSSRKAKATNAGVGLKTIIHEYPPTVSDHFPLKGGRCLRLQSTSFVFPCPLGESGQIHPTYFVILSPASIQVRRIFKTLQKGDSSGFRPQNDGTLVSLASPRPLGEREETNQLNTFTPSDNKETPGFSINTKLQVINRRYYNLGSFLRFHCCFLVCLTDLKLYISFRY